MRATAAEARADELAAALRESQIAQKEMTLARRKEGLITSRSLQAPSLALVGLPHHLTSLSCHNNSRALQAVAPIPRCAGTCIAINSMHCRRRSA